MKVSVFTRLLFFILAFFVIGHSVQATHLRAGEITVERVSCSELTFRITVTVFTNASDTPVKFGGDTNVSFLYFGDGDRVFVPETQNIIRTDLDPNGSIGMASFTATHTYSGYGTYKIRYQEPNRNANVLNMNSSVNTLFYIETEINLDLFLDARGGCSNSPKLLVPPIDKACVGAKWTHNPGAYDPDDKDSLSYELVIPNQAEGVNVMNYRDPNNLAFYRDPNNGIEGGGGRPQFSIDPRYGTITWDAPGTQGEYNIAFVIREWREFDGEWIQMGFVRRDMQIIVEDCENRRPLLDIPKNLCVVAGTNIREAIGGTDPDDFDDMVLIEAFSPILSAISNPAQMVYPAPDPSRPKYVNKPATNVFFEWQTECIHVREQPYSVVFKITDDPPANKGPKLVTFETWTIKVVGPPPVWDAATRVPSTKSVNLTWDPYLCANADSIQIWRKVDGFEFTPDSCETGMPAYAGFTLIKRLPLVTGGAAVTTFLDDNNGQGLSAGAKYCYRLVAEFPGAGGESYVSEQICVDPFEIDVPLITHVTVDKTDVEDGQITVKWVAPLEADPVVFPGPFEYQVFRGEGFTGALGQNPITTTSDLEFTDTGINTEENVYNYVIKAIPAADTVLTSKSASSVRLEAKSLLQRIQLDWSAFVPWTNQVNEAGYVHVVYRGPDGASDPADFTELATVNPVTGGLTYVDGVTVPLEEDDKFCYRVLTRGRYGPDTGTPGLDGPFENFSQIICAQPGDSIKPCKPLPPRPQTPISCEEYVKRFDTCRENSFSNTLVWDRPSDPDCRDDVAYYNVYVASSTTSEYLLLKSGVRATMYEDLNLPSFARCYKISAVDRSGNESELSDPICFDNCPYYELPNIFTPNLDDCNSVFSAYSGNDRYQMPSPDPENPLFKCGGIRSEDLNKCARFVERVIFHVYNRWGKEVYSYVGATNDDKNTIYIDWDGRASDKTDLAAGIYYYVAEVTFDSVDPTQREKTIKGWVHLMR